MLNIVDCGFDENRLIRNDLWMDVSRQAGTNLLQPVLDVRGRGHRIFARLFGDHQSHGGYSVQTRGRHRFLVAILRIPDVIHLNHVAAANGDGDLVELLGLGNAASGANRKIAGALLQAASG